jgi:membrane dipeptidase
VVVLNFWATWCPPCVEELPSLMNLQDRMRSRGVVVLGISIDVDADAYHRFLKQRNVNFITVREALGEPEDLRVFYNLGVRSIGLTWNYDNKYSASCLSTKDYGLTGEGEALVALANKLGVMIDLSHSSPKTASDALDVSGSPPFFSHSNALSQQASKRNVSDTLLRRTWKRGGIVGLTFIRSCIGSPFTPERLARHAKHMIKTGGGSLPALGTDYLGMGSTPVGLEDLSRLGRLRKALKGAGLSSDQVGAVLNDNAYGYILKSSERW